MQCFLFSIIFLLFSCSIASAGSILSAAGSYNYTVASPAQVGVVYTQAGCTSGQANEIMSSWVGSSTGMCGQTGGPFDNGWDTSKWDCVYKNLGGTPYQIRVVMYPTPGNENLVSGCSYPSEPCYDKEVDIDTDRDGICDRCDNAPNDNTVGRYLYGISQEVNPAGETVNIWFTFLPVARYLALPPAKRKVGQEVHLFDFENGEYDPSAIVSLELQTTEVKFTGHPIVGTMNTCKCDADCDFTFIEGAPVATTSGTGKFPDTAAPVVGQTGETVPTSDTPENGTVAPTGEHGTTEGSVAIPSQVTNNDEYLDSIAGNAQVSAQNSKIIGDILDNGLNALNAATREVIDHASGIGSKLDGIADKIGESMEITADTSGISDNAYDSGIEQPEEGDLEGTLSDWISQGVPFGDVVTGSSVVVHSADPVITYTIYGQQKTIDFSKYGSVLAAMGLAINGFALMSAYFIVAGRG